MLCSRKLQLSEGIAHVVLPFDQVEVDHIQFPYVAEILEVLYCDATQVKRFRMEARIARNDLVWFQWSIGSKLECTCGFVSIDVLHQIEFCFKTCWPPGKKIPAAMLFHV